MKKILVICSANLIRSPLATALLQKKLAQEHVEGIEVFSAGTWAETGLSAHDSVRALEPQYGIDMKDHLSKMVNGLMITEADVVYVMEANHLEALRIEFPDQMNKFHLISSLKKQAYDIPNPSGDVASCIALAREFSEIFDLGLPVIFDHLEIKPAS
jgi:protein-tyrosine phosphatase